MPNKVFGTDFTDDTNPQSTWTISANNGTALKDVTLGNVLKILAQLSGESSPANSDSVLLWDASASEVNQVTLSNLYKGMLDDGWITSEETWTYSSADSPTFVASVNADMTVKLAAGCKVKLTQTTAKYFIITAVGSFSGGATLITLYGGTDYTLANAAITSPFYSYAKSPQGFPLDPDKWTVSLSDTSNRSQASPTQNIWYNVGSLSISIPIGCWRTYYECVGEVVTTLAAAAIIGYRITLSTANNSESDTGFTSRKSSSMPIMTGATDRFSVHREKILNLAAKTSYYLNISTGAASTTSVSIRGDDAPTIVRCVCAYL